MIARIIMPENGIRPTINTLETGTHFMCRRTSDNAATRLAFIRL